MSSYPKLERIEFVDRYVVRGHLRNGTVRDLDFGTVRVGDRREDRAGVT